MPKTPRTYRFSDDTLAAIARLKAKRGVSETRLIEQVILEADERLRVMSEPLDAEFISSEKLQIFFENMERLIANFKPKKARRKR